MHINLTLPWIYKYHQEGWLLEGLMESINCTFLKLFKSSTSYCRKIAPYWKNGTILLCQKVVQNHRSFQRQKWCRLWIYYSRLEKWSEVEGGGHTKHSKFELSFFFYGNLQSRTNILRRKSEELECSVKKKCLCGNDVTWVWQNKCKGHY